MSEGWKQRPTLIENWDEEIDYIMAIDENGITDLEFFHNQSAMDLFTAVYGSNRVFDNDRWFTTTGVVMARNQYSRFKDDITSIKMGHWDDGKYLYKGKLKRVVFHSREIRKREGPFEPSQINYADFIKDLSNFIERTPFITFSSSIDKVRHVSQYSRNAFHVYNLCLNFIVERFCILLNRQGKRGILFLESRGKKEDHELLRFLVNLLEKGNNFHRSDHFRNILGVYFNPKWSKSHDFQASFPLLELADLVSFPIYKYVRTEKKDIAFEVVEKKLHAYPLYNGYGLKKFP